MKRSRSASCFPEPRKFIPQNRQKYVGKYPIIARSSWELDAFRWLDLNKNIINWGSESAVVNYYDPTRPEIIHRYFIDLSFLVKNMQGETVKYFVEIKPHKQTIAPIKTPRKATKTFMNESINYVRNMCKWKAAIEFAEHKGAKFAVWTEKGCKVLDKANFKIKMPQGNGV